MATAHSPVRTRSQAATTAAPEANVLEAVLLELQQLREERRQERQEQQRFRGELEARFRERDTVLQRLEEQLTTELSPSNNIRGNPSEATREAGAGTGAGVGACGDRESRALKLRPDTYDGAAPLREFLAQFSLISRANQWDETEKAVVLASSLRGKARSLLDSCADSMESLTYAELKAKLELRFGESELAQNFYLQFTNRKQCPGEDFATLGADLECLSRKAYPECSPEVRDKIACSQFLAALTDGFVKRSLQVEGVASLRIAIERAKTLKFINQNSFSGKRDGMSGSFRFRDVSEAAREEKGEEGERVKKIFKKRNEERRAKECWKCGATGHFRSECPVKQRQEN